MQELTAFLDCARRLMFPSPAESVTTRSPPLAVTRHTVDCEPRYLRPARKRTRPADSARRRVAHPQPPSSAVGAVSLSGPEQAEAELEPLENPNRNTNDSCRPSSSSGFGRPLIGSSLALHRILGLGVQCPRSTRLRRPPVQFRSKHLNLSNPNTRRRPCI